MTLEQSPEFLTLARLYGDREWRLNNLYYIKDKDGKSVLFKPNRAQKRLLRRVWYRNLILKARQLGMTTFVMVLMLDATVFGQDVTCGVIAHGLREAQSLMNDKIRYAYERLPEWVRAKVPPVGDSKSELMLANGSRIWVGTSFRSGTLQYLHISEFGKICAKYPARAQEVVTGALEAVGKGGIVFVESTAEGRAGYFYDWSTAAEKAQLAKTKLTPLDMRFHFFAWHEDPEYSIDSDGVVIPDRLITYFFELRHKYGIALTAGQMAWYVKKEAALGADMKREYPSTPAEAFAQAIDGAYYAEQFRLLYARGQIGEVPHNPTFPVETWWDLGHDDYTAIWFVQRIGAWIHVIDYYENCGEGMQHYAKVLQDRGYTYCRHVGPHDADHHWVGNGKSTAEQAVSYGIRFDVQPRADIMSGINAVRQLLLLCRFDESKTEVGLEKLQRYRKEWNDKMGCWRDRPLHDDASHPSDAFRTGAMAAVEFSTPKPVAQQPSAQQTSKRRGFGR